MRYQELEAKQIQNIRYDRKLDINDMKRLSKYIKNSIFGSECSEWTGHMCRPSEVQVFLNGIRVNVQRLLYINFVGELQQNQILLQNCPMGKKCVCLAHMKVVKYKKKGLNELPTNLEPHIDYTIKKPSLILNFD